MSNVKGKFVQICCLNYVGTGLIAIGQIVVNLIVHVTATMFHILIVTIHPNPNL